MYRLLWDCLTERLHYSPLGISFRHPLSTLDKLHPRLATFIDLVYCSTILPITMYAVTLALWNDEEYYLSDLGDPYEPPPFRDSFSRAFFYIIFAAGLLSAVSHAFHRLLASNSKPLRFDMLNPDAHCPCPKNSHSVTVVAPDDFRFPAGFKHFISTLKVYLLVRKPYNYCIVCVG